MPAHQRVVAQTTLAQLAPHAPVSWGEVPLVVLHEDPGRSVVRHTAVIGRALGRRGLMDVLYALAPYKAHGPDRFARVLDNWRLYDRAMTSSASHNLLLQHAGSLKSSWKVFSEHRARFISILEDEAEGVRAAPLIAWETHSDGSRRCRFDATGPALEHDLAEAAPFLSAPDASGRLGLDALLGLVTIPYLLPELTRHWRAWQPLVKNGKSNYIGPASVPVVALMHRRAIMNCSLIRSLEAIGLDEGAETCLRS